MGELKWLLLSHKTGIIKFVSVIYCVFMRVNCLNYRKNLKNLWSELAKKSIACYILIKHLCIFAKNTVFLMIIFNDTQKCNESL